VTLTWHSKGYNQGKQTDCDQCARFADEVQYNKTSITESKIEKPARLYRLPCEKAGAALPPPCAERLARLCRLLRGKAGAALPPPVRKGWRGFAASRAESLWLSVMRATLLAATPPEAKPLRVISCQRKAGGFPHGKRQSRSPKITSNQRSFNQRSLQRSLLTAHVAYLEPFVTDTNVTGPSNPELLNVCDAQRSPRQEVQRAPSFLELPSDRR
jgi:hypothetical protein